MNKVTLIIILLSVSSFSLANEETITKQQNEERGARIVRELIYRDMPKKTSTFLEFCDHEINRQWCEGYYSAIIAELKDTETTLCIPKNGVGRYSFNGVWVITKAWIYRQSEEKEATFRNVVKAALRENRQCRK